MADTNLEYTFTHRAATRGASGVMYQIRPLVPFAAPAGEFDHLGADAGFTTRALPAAGVVAPLPPGADPSRDVVVSATPGTPPDPAASQAGFPASQGAAADADPVDADDDGKPGAKAPAKRRAK